jgi:hypothetical protein
MGHFVLGRQAARPGSGSSDSLAMSLIRSLFIREQHRDETRALGTHGRPG